MERHQGHLSQNGAVLPEARKTPLNAIHHLVESDDAGIYVFLDIHRHFTPIIIRLVRDAVWTVSARNKASFSVSRAVDAPGLQGDATLLFTTCPAWKI